MRHPPPNLLLLALLAAAPASAQQLAPDPQAAQTFYCTAFFQDRVAAIPAIAIETKRAIEESGADLRTKIDIEQKMAFDAREQMQRLRRLVQQSAFWRLKAGGADEERAAIRQFQTDAGACQAAIDGFARYQSSKQCMANLSGRPGATIIDCAEGSELKEAKSILEHCGRMARCEAFAKGMR